jgi:hypothetical protein
MIIVIGGVVLGVVALVGLIVWLVIRRRRKIAAGEPVFHFRKKNGTRWY